MNINPNLYPPTGYRFKDEDGLIHKANNWKSLARKVGDYRARNKKPVGDPMAEIVAQFCATSPAYCRSGAEKRIDRRPAGRQWPGELTQRVMNWVQELISRKRLNMVGKVSRAEAARRAAICRNCPRQQALSGTCGACLKTIRDAGDAILGEKPVDQSLRGCSAVREDTRISVHLDLPAPQVIVGELPAKCWRRS